MLYLYQPGDPNKVFFIAPPPGGKVKAGDVVELDEATFERFRDYSPRPDGQPCLVPTVPDGPTEAALASEGVEVVVNLAPALSRESASEVIAEAIRPTDKPTDKPRRGRRAKPKG